MQITNKQNFFIYLKEIIMDNKSNFNVRDERNLTMLVDFYELTMGNGYFDKGLKDKIAYFDMFFRRIPDEGGYCIMAGVEQLIEYLKALKFTDDDITYLRNKDTFSEDFLDYLKNFKFENFKSSDHSLIFSQSK